MSVPTEGQEPEGLDLGTDPASSMAEILGFLAPEQDDAPAEPGAAAGGAAPAEPGQQPAPAEGAGGAGAPAPAPAGGDGSQQPVAPAAGDGAAPAATGDAGDAGAAADARGVIDASELTDAWANISTGFEQNQQALFEQDARAAVQAEYPKYFEALNMHPRQLIGQSVPRADGKPGEETLRDAADAESWQGAIKHALVGEIRERVARQQDELKPVFETVHASIDLFRNNADLIPGTKQFDKQLADEFAELAKAYELRSDGKLVGYSVPVQPMVNQLRTKLAASRAAAPAAPAAPTAQQQRAAEQARTPGGQFDGPQAGISAKAGSSADPGENIGAGVLAAFARQNGFSI